MKVISVRKVNKDKFTFVIKSAQVTEANITYDVSIGKSPSCSCPIGLLTKRTVCKHILFVYLYVLRITESFTTIQQIEHTKAELKPVINACEQYQSFQYFLWVEVKTLKILLTSCLFQVQ